MNGGVVGYIADKLDINLELQELGSRVCDREKGRGICKMY